VVGVVDFQRSTRRVTFFVLKSNDGLADTDISTVLVAKEWVGVVGPGEYLVLMDGFEEPKLLSVSHHPQLLSGQ
jgi:hypothetical protein